MSVTDNEQEVILTVGNSSVSILKYGATVTSWKKDAKEQLFLSEKAVLDGSKAVRGGIPLVFPVFGKANEGPCSQLPQHGFARNHAWEFLGKTTESPLTVQFGLGPENLSQQAKDAWNYDFTLLYSVSLTDDGLTTRLEVENTDDKPFEFNVLFHTYFKIDDISKVSVEGLENADVNDKVSVSNYKGEQSITINQEVDRVYANIKNNDVTIKSENKPQFTVTLQENLPDVVVWNPWIQKAEGMGDFHPKDGYKNMICIEAGSVAKWNNIKPGEKWQASQSFKAML